MKRTAKIIILLLLLPLSSVFAQDPEGWASLKQTIEGTLFSDVASLRNRTFDLELTGTTNEYTLTVQPENVFTVNRIGRNKFRVTITNPEALVDRRRPIVKYYPIGWQKTASGIDPFPPVIIPEGACLYQITFSQPGVGPIDLSAYAAEYDLSYELSNKPSILSVTQSGRGYDVVRAPNSSSDSKIKLIIRERNGDLALETDWAPIPICTTGANPAPTPVPTPTPMPLDEGNATDLLDVNIAVVSICEDATGQYCSTVQVNAVNNGQRLIHCNKIWVYMKYGDQVVASDYGWVDLGPGRTTSFQLTLKAPYRPENMWSYEVRKTECSFR